MAADVFISYRGADRVLARRLENRLRSRWGNRVFRDETGVKSGRNWAKELTDAMQEARVIIALIGPGWHLSTDKHAEDWVRKELALAVEGAKPILPVLVGKSEELRPKLAAMPEAFRKQAVVVGPDLAGFDLHEIAIALGRLGASQSDGAWSLAARRDEMVPKDALDEGEKAIANGESLLLVGSSGSGRHALICRLVENLKMKGHLVASYGVGLGGSSRHTHAVISGWIQSLSDTFRDLTSPFAATHAGQALVKSILDAGPDLLSRKVVKAGTLLPLGGTQHDQMILEAVRRSTDRWAPFPPTRLRNQSRAVIEKVIEKLWESVAGNSKTPILAADKKLILVVDHFDSVDSNSEELVKDLLEEPIHNAQGKVQFVIATYDSRRTARSESKWLEAFRRIDIDAQADWGDHIKPWLAAHNVELAESVEKCIEDEKNPYQALAKLWYLVDNGLVTEPPRPRPKGRRKKTQTEDDVKPVIWDMARSYKQVQRQQKPRRKEAPPKHELPPEKELLTQDRLLDHMVSEHVPVKFRRLVEAGALMGRTFSFHAAYAASNPPATDETVDEPLSVRERDEWLRKAGDVWTNLKTIDPDRSVISCTESDSGDLLVSLAQAHLIGHLRNQLSPRDARIYHQRLARYLMKPIKELDQDDYGDRYHRANLAAEHWSLAERPRDAADAHRNAAQLAELSLAYGESRDHYHTAIRLYTQLLAEREDPTREHEDLLILANCYYRVGQTTRLSGNPHREEKIDDEKRPWGATNYLDRARERLEELKKLLLKNEPDRWPDGITGPCTRGIPGPNLVRHHLRVYNAVSGHVHLELAQCHEAVADECRAHAGEEIHTCSKCETDHRAVRDRLFDALRHAEAAQGKRAADGYWLPRPRLAALLTDEALRVERDNETRAGELAVEAFFHIERIIGLEPYTTEEQHEFADPVSVAWRSAGRLFRHRALDSRIAEWCFRKMNTHGEDITASVDMLTDRWLGGFLLSICEPGTECAEPGEPESIIDEAKRLLERHRDWAIESGIVNWRTPAHLRLYLLELVGSADEISGQQKQQARQRHLDMAVRHAKTDRQKRECSLFQACEKIITADREPFSPDVVENFREALMLHSDSNAADYVDDEDVIQQGATRLAGMLLRRCPRLHRLFEKKVDLEWLASAHDIEYWLSRAEKYELSLETGRILSPCIDHDKNAVIRRLAKTRLTKIVFQQAEETAKQARQLLKDHQVQCEAEEGEGFEILKRDVEYAAFMHDWYRGTDPARLLTLASEWNLTISGEEWSNPRLLQGRLASKVLKKMYDAENVLGQSRYQRITNMVENCVVGREDQTALGQVFFLANAISEQLHKAPFEEEIESRDWLLKKRKDPKFTVQAAYEVAIERSKRGIWDLGYVHASNEQISTVTDNPLPLESPPDDEAVGA